MFLISGALCDVGHSLLRVRDYIEFICDIFSEQTIEFDIIIIFVLQMQKLTYQGSYIHTCEECIANKKSI